MPSFGPTELVLFALYGYLRFSKKARVDVLPWATAVAGVPAFFLGIFALFAPQHLTMFQNLFRA